MVPTNLADMVAVNLLDRGLTSIDPTHNQAVPALATKWVSNAPKPTSTSAPPRPGPRPRGPPRPAPATVGDTWTFTIDPQARFADGSTVTPADIIASLTAVARTGNSTLAGARLDVIEGYADLVTGKTSKLSGLVAGDGTRAHHHHRTRRRAAVAAGLAGVRGGEAGPRAGTQGLDGHDRGRVDHHGGAGRAAGVGAVQAGGR